MKWNLSGAVGMLACGVVSALLLSSCGIYSHMYQPGYGDHETIGPATHNLRPGSEPPSNPLEYHLALMTASWEYFTTFGDWPNLGFAEHTTDR